MAWRVLLTALNRIENSDGQAHIIDPKAISKDDLYGYMDQNTRNNYFQDYEIIIFFSRINRRMD
jgi:hypothetical protein